MHRERSAALAWWAAATIFVSAFLLFQVQPIISKKILPWFGGSPAVWTTALLFFQTALLAGYAYAHVLMRFVPLTPRVRAGLEAIPLAVMAGIMAPALLRGGVPEIAGTIATVGAIKLGGNDLLAILAGLATVAALRQLA